MNDDRKAWRIQTFDRTGRGAILNRRDNVTSVLGLHSALVTVAMACAQVVNTNGADPSTMHVMLTRIR